MNNTHNNPSNHPPTHKNPPYPRPPPPRLLKQPPPTPTRPRCNRHYHNPTARTLDHSRRNLHHNSNRDNGRRNKRNPDHQRILHPTRGTRTLKTAQSTPLYPFFLSSPAQWHGRPRPQLIPLK